MMCSIPSHLVEGCYFDLMEKLVHPGRVVEYEDVRSNFDPYGHCPTKMKVELLIHDENFVTLYRCTFVTCVFHFYHSVHRVFVNAMRSSFQSIFPFYKEKRFFEKMEEDDPEGKRHGKGWKHPNRGFVRVIVCKRDKFSGSVMTGRDMRAKFYFVDESSQEGLSSHRNEGLQKVEILYEQGTLTEEPEHVII